MRCSEGLKVCCCQFKSSLWLSEKLRSNFLESTHYCQVISLLYTKQTKCSYIFGPLRCCWNIRWINVHHSISHVGIKEILHHPVIIPADCPYKYHPGSMIPAPYTSWIDDTGSLQGQEKWSQPKMYHLGKWNQLPS